MTRTLKLLGILSLIFGTSTSILAQSICGEQDPFWLPPSRTFCVDSSGIATVSFKLLNLGAPGNYTVSFPDGATAEYSGIEDTVTVIHELEFICSNPPGFPSLPTAESPFYAYQGELTIVRTDCVDSQGDPQRGSYDFNVIPNPLERIKTSQLNCLSSPFLIDMEALLCQQDLVEEYQWYLDGEPIPNSNSEEVKSLLIADAGRHMIRVEATTTKEGCGPFYLEKEIIVTEAPVLDVDFLVDSSTLCLPQVNMAVVTSASNVSDFKWTSDSPDVIFSDPSAPSPVITINNQVGGRRVITLTANSQSCGSVSESFTLVTYNDQKFRTIGALETCVNDRFDVCDYLVDPLVVASISWSDTDVSTRIVDGTTTCPEITFTRPGNHVVIAEGVDICGREFSYPMNVRVRDNLPLTIDVSAVDSLCDQEDPVDLSEHISPWANVATITGPGVTGRKFNPSGLGGALHLVVTDSCGQAYDLPVYVIRTGTFTAGNPVICQGDRLDLASLQRGNYTGPGVQDNVFDSEALDPGIYEISFVSDEYCGGEGAFTITVQSPPHADFSVASPSCPGADAGTLFPAKQPLQLVNLSVSPVVCYSVLETGESSCDTNTAKFTFSEAGTYTLQQVVGSRGTGCRDTLTKIIEIREAFTPVFTHKIIDEGCDSITLSLSSAGLPSGVIPGWSLSNGKVLQARNHTLRLRRPYDPKSMTVEVSASNGCFEYVDTMTVNLPRRFQVDFGILNDNRTVCSGDTVYLKDNSVNASHLSVRFPDGSTAAALPEFLVLRNATDEVMEYPITVSGSNPSCGDQVAIDTVFVLPVSTRAGFSLAYEDNCSAEEVTLVNLSTEGSSGILHWGDDSSPQWIESGDTVRHRFVATADTTFTISLAATLCGTDTYRANYRVRARPSAEFAVQALEASCVGDTLLFLPERNAASGSSYDWDFGDGYFSQHHQPRHAYDQPGTYVAVLEVTTPAGCVTTDTTLVAVQTYTGEPIAATIPEVTCVGGLFPVEVSAPAHGVRFTYGHDRHTKGALLRPFSRPGNTAFTITATDGNGCRIDTTTTVTVKPELTVQIEPDSRDTTLELGDRLNLTFITNPERSLDSIQWFGSGIGDPFDPVVNLTPVADELYRLEVGDQYGCTAADSIMVRVRTDYRDRVYTPNVFTPNGDGTNEVFALFVKPNTVRSINSLRIISRWGTVVYECTDCGKDDMEHGWDGEIDGKRAKSGVYLWAAQVEFVDGAIETFTGDVVLLN